MRKIKGNREKDDHRLSLIWLVGYIVGENYHS